MKGGWEGGKEEGGDGKSAIKKGDKKEMGKKVRKSFVFSVVLLLLLIQVRMEQDKEKILMAKNKQNKKVLSY